MQCSAVQYSAVQYSAVQYSAVQYSAVQYSTVQYTTVQCSTVQCSTVQCSAVQCSAEQCSTCSAVQYSTVQCMQYSAVQCSAVQCSTYTYMAVVLFSAATHYHYVNYWKSEVERRPLPIRSYRQDLLRKRHMVCERRDSPTIEQAAYVRYAFQLSQPISFSHDSYISVITEFAMGL